MNVKLSRCSVGKIPDTGIYQSLITLVLLLVSVLMLTIPIWELTKASTFSISPDPSFEDTTRIYLNVTFENSTKAILRDYITVEQGQAIIDAIESILSDEELPAAEFEPLEESVEEEPEESEDGSGNGGGNGGGDDTDEEEDNEDILPPPPNDNNGNSTDDNNSTVIVCIPEDRECNDEFLCPGEETVWDIGSQRCVPATAADDSDSQLVDTSCGPIDPSKSFCYYLPQDPDRPTAKEVAQKAEVVVDDE